MSQPIDVVEPEPATNHHVLAERISLMMTFAGESLTEFQQNVLASALRIFQAEIPK